MTLSRAALVLATLVATGTCWAGGKDQTGAAAQANTQQSGKSDRAKASAPTAPPAAAPQGKPVDQPQLGNLTPRTPLKKPVNVKKPAGESRLLVKFRDDAKVRLAPDKSFLSRSSADAAVAEISAVANQFNLTFTPAINKNEQFLSALEMRAAAHSAKAQPDLAGMMYVDGPANSLESAARALNNLSSVEFAYFQLAWHPYDLPPKSGDDGGIAGGGGGGVGACCIAVDGVTNCVDGVTENDCTTQGGLYEGDGTTCAGIPGGCPTLGACCLVDQTCVPLAEDQCTGLGGTYHGDGSNCILDNIDCNNTGCGDPQFGSCFLPHDGLPGDPDPSPFCDDVDCCNIVGDIRPFCIDENVGNWDVICVAIAHLFCAVPPADRCLSLINGSCFTPHATQGCIDSVCCYTVCGIDTFCCEVEWDVTCVQLAEDNCNPFPPNGPTPDFTPLQGYLRRTAYNDQPGGAPLGIALPAPNFPGYGGEGWWLFDDSLMIDDPNATPTSVRFAGLYGLGRQFQEVYHVGDANQARGLGVKVAVIEWACYKNHEDLDVIPEPGQTMIMIPDITSPSHATACLGIIGAKYNGFGIVGIAPDAQEYFFPLTSVEEGPRFLTAFVSCYDTLGPGDVVSCSFGPGGSNLNNDPGDWVLIRFGSDLGITTCVAAGNDCRKLDDLPDDLGDSGAIVVGACSPGRFFCRLTFSNFWEDLAAGDSRRVDVAAWGDAVTSCATSVPNLFFPNENWNRSYGNAFNGTSAATPQIAALAACLQGFAKQFYGIALSPGQIKAALTADGFPQCGVPNPADLPGFPSTIPCGPDTDFEEGPNRIGPYPRPDRSLAFIVSQSGGGFDQSPLIDGFTVIRGVLNYGNVFSLKASDANYLVVSTLWTEQNFQPPIPGPASQVNYLATAQTADLMVTAHSDKKTASAMLIDTEMQPSTQPGLMFIEMYDWVAQEWSFVDFGDLNDGIPCGPQLQNLCNQFTATVTPSRFINPNNNNVLIRFYVIGMGGPDPNGGNNNDPNVMSFPVRWDRVNLSIANGFGQGGAGSP